MKNKASKSKITPGEMSSINYEMMFNSENGEDDNSSFREERRIKR